MLTVRAIRSGLLASAALLGAADALSQGVAAGDGGAQPERWAQQWAIHGQFTNVTQWHPRFRSPYSGAHSLKAKERAEETTDATLFAGLRVGDTELWLNPEIDQGFGLSDGVGLAGFSSGEAFKAGANTPYLRLPRAFLRHTVALGGAQQRIDAAPNQLGGTTSADRLVLTVGRFSAVDIFDDNRYAHDPRADFLNWALIDAGAFDYAADEWGFTFGAVAEWNKDWWTLRGGVFQLSDVPNEKVAGLHPRQHMLVAELETRHAWRGHPGKLRLLAFVNRADMAQYRDAVQLARATGGVPDVALVRRYQSRPGAVVNVEQELADGLGVFARASANDGSKEAYDFTEINKSLAAGLSLNGRRWGRAGDTFGLAAVVNGLSGAAREYFAAGGMGILIGDGRLNYAREQIVEAYYAARLLPQLVLTLDYQHIRNPAYNADRGPVSIWGVRVNAAF